MVVISGDNVTISDTLDTKVYVTAIFSAMKYTDPPQTPHSINITSSRNEFENSGFGQIIKVNKYASINLRRYISTAVKPLLSNTLVEINEAPHAVTAIAVGRNIRLPHNQDIN